MNEREDLEKAIAHLESQRDQLGDDAVDAALTGLYNKLAQLEIERDLDSPADTDGQRRLVTILFADLVGFTAQTERMDPEAARELTQDFFETIVPIVEKYGGTIDKYIGDEIMALFGAPKTNEDDPERALRAALEMRDKLRELNQKRETDLHLHFGINTGLVFAGEVGTSQHHSYSVVGDAVNLAARLQDASGAGEIFVGPDTYRATKPLFEFERLHPMMVKGKREPVQVYNLVGFKDETQPARGLFGLGMSSPLIGREIDLQAIEDHLQGLLAGSGGIISILGSAGVGKSRLMAEARLRFQENFAQENLVWLEGKAYSYGHTISYLPFQQIISTYAGIRENEEESVALKKLENTISPLFPEGIEEIAPYLATILALGDEYQAADAEILESETIGRRVFLAARRLFSRIAAEKPLVLIFDDFHWIDDSSVRLLEHLLPLIERVPLLICLLSRPNHTKQGTLFWDAADELLPQKHTRIQLSLLSETEGEQLVTSLLGSKSVPLELQKAILRRSEGNPFYIEEIIRAMIDMGMISRERSGEGWRVADQLDSFTLPETIQGVIIARVDSLNSALKMTLGAGAVIGRTFPLRILSDVLNLDHDQLEHRLSQLSAAEFIYEQAGTAEREFIFKHVLIQEATYENLLLSQRRALHKQVGESIRRLYSDRLDEFYSILAYHFARAEQWTEAQDYLLKAADQEGKMAADAEALAHYGQALEANKQMAGAQWNSLQRAILFRKMGQALYRRGEYGETYRYLQQALVLLGRPLPESTWQIRQAIAAGVVKQLRYSLPLGVSMSRSNDLPDAVVEEIGRVYECLIGWAMVQEPELAILITLKMLNFSESYGLLPGMIIGNSMVSLLLDLAGQRKLAGYYIQKGLYLVEENNEPQTSDFAYSSMALHQNILGNWDEVLTYAGWASRVHQEQPYWNAFGFDFTTLCFADAHIHQGNFADALGYGEKLCTLGEDSGDRLAWCWGLSRMGFAQKGLGQLGDAIQCLKQAMELAWAMPNYQTYVDAGGELGACLLRKGKEQEALEIFNKCRLLTVDHNFNKSPVTTRYKNGLLEVYLQLAEQVTGDKKKTWLQEAQDAASAALEQGKVYIPGMPEALMLNGRLYWLLGDENKARQVWKQGRTLAEQMNVQFDLGRLLLEIGRHTKDLDLINSAISIFTQTGSQWELAKAKEYEERIENGKSTTSRT